MKKSLVWILAMLAPLALVACGSSEPAEAPAPVQEQSSAGEEVEDLMKDAADALSESAESAGDAVDSAVEETQEAAEEAGAAASEALDDAEKAVEAAAERAGEKADELMEEADAATDELMEEAAEVLDPSDENHEKLIGTNWQLGDFKVEFKSSEDVKISGGPLAALAPDGLDATYTYDEGAIVVNAMGQSKEGTWDGENLVVDGEQGVLLPAS